jgi:FtsP/CotA-like multicopper oxidase with cupredoxin domain
VGRFLACLSICCQNRFSRKRSHPYVLRIAASAIEISPKHIVSTITYNGEFPGPLLRFKEGQPTKIEIYNDTDTPEQLHWHGQIVSTEVDGAAEEGTPYALVTPLRFYTFKLADTRTGSPKNLL